jgi:uncharacterized coiled-coil DUF342 family protein
MRARADFLRAEIVRANVDSKEMHQEFSDIQRKVLKMV